MATWARRTLLGLIPGFAVCAAGGSCACIWDRKTGKGYRGCPCSKGKECVTGKCSKRYCK